jgi:hypothetical protein
MLFYSDGVLTVLSNGLEGAFECQLPSSPQTSAKAVEAKLSPASRTAAPRLSLSLASKIVMPRTRLLPAVASAAGPWEKSDFPVIRRSLEAENIVNYADEV